jgi:hypothetical protein
MEGIRGTYILLSNFGGWPERWTGRHYSFHLENLMGIIWILKRYELDNGSYEITALLNFIWLQITALLNFIWL